ncbi:alpha/beta fold hydrolase [Haloactinomyces albus]|uniref:Pimeloyl-ACP methyl ester carboxylesterase n=1 Tax=Haloactinomyces albus TaxID=1352928 RepID=A0AAE3ZDG8_9ACTN|nr:alpha/beta hydrolase [Haloactinomyces albus]MDR7302882.1 pimeloyl-ACP methyl ester carboxylesterase [Haloactinomyces albus]
MTVEQHVAAAPTFTAGDGTDLRVHEDGPSEAPITVVFVHGWTLSRHSWDRVVAELPVAAGMSVRSMSFDLRGHGDSDPAPAGTATIRQCADDLAELLADRVPEGPVVLAGHSMGGMTVMALAERHPQLFADRVSGVALVATSSGDLAAPSLGLPKPLAALFNAGERAVRSRLAAARGRAVTKRSRWMRPGLRWLLFGAEPARADIAATADWVAACHPPSMAGFRASLADHDRVEALAALRSIPVVVLAGLADRLCPYPHARRIVETLPHAEHLVYAGAGHMLPLERSDEVTARIADLVRTVVR